MIGTSPLQQHDILQLSLRQFRKDGDGHLPSGQDGRHTRFDHVLAETVQHISNLFIHELVLFGLIFLSLLIHSIFFFGNPYF